VGVKKMANVLYPKGKEAYLSAAVDMTSDTIKVALIKTSAGYTYSAAHQYYSDVTPGSNTIGTPQTFTTKTVTNGVFDADNVTFTAVTGAAVGAVIIYKDTGVAGTSPLIAYIDTATGIPVTPNGGDITISWDNGSNKIFAL